MSGYCNKKLIYVKAFIILLNFFSLNLVMARSCPPDSVPPSHESYQTGASSETRYLPTASLQLCELLLTQCPGAARHVYRKVPVPHSARPWLVRVAIIDRECVWTPCLPPRERRHWWFWSIGWTFFCWSPERCALAGAGETLEPSFLMLSPPFAFTDVHICWLVHARQFTDAPLVVIYNWKYLHFKSLIYE